MRGVLKLERTCVGFGKSDPKKAIHVAVMVLG